MLRRGLLHPARLPGVERSMWLVQVFDLDAGHLGEVEQALRAMTGVGVASAFRDEQPYVVAECPTQRDAILAQEVVARIDPNAIVVHTTAGADGAHEPIGL